MKIIMEESKFPIEVDFVRVGDIIQCDDFEYGMYNMNVLRNHMHDPASANFPIMVGSNLGNTKLIGSKGIIDFSCDDPSRALAHYVVEHAEMEGGSETGYHGSSYPDGYHVYARRLNSDDSYNPQGEVIMFIMSNFYIYNVLRVNLIKPMAMSWSSKPDRSHWWRNLR